MKKIFISYSNKDEEWKNRLITHLKVMQMEYWVDTKIQAGEKWHQKIESALNESDVAILLISVNFLSSDFILNEEVPRLLKREAQDGIKIFPLIIKPCEWDEIEWLSKFQRYPRNGEPLSGGNAHQIDNVLTEFVKEVCEILKSPSRRYQSTRPDDIGQNRVTTINYELLPYLLDREDQLNRFYDLIESHISYIRLTPLICVIHGDDYQGHERFIECIQKHYWPQNFGINSEKPGIEVLQPLTWPGSINDYSQIEKRLLREIKMHYLDDEPISLIYDKIAEKFNANYQHPTIIWTHILVNNKAEDRHAFRQFLKFWEKWPKRPKGAFLIICMLIRYTQKETKLRGWWTKPFSRKWPKKSPKEKVISYIEEAEKEGALHKLPELGNIHRSHVHNWAHCLEVKNLCKGHDFTPCIREIFNSNETYAMEKIALKLEKALKNIMGMTTGFKFK